MPPTILAQHLYSYQSDAAGIRTVLATASDGTGTVSLGNQVIYWNANGSPQLIFTPSVLATDLRGVFSRDYEYFCDGVFADLLKWTFNGALTAWGVYSPASPLILGVPSVGVITLLTGRSYYTVFFNTLTQNYSDLSPISPSTGILTLNDQPLTSIPICPDTTYDSKLLLATADGNDPTVLYQLAILSRTDTTYTDNTAELDLLMADVWQYTDTNGVDHGVVDNQPPPNGSFPIKHNGRLFMATGPVVRFSKSLAEMVTATGNIAGRYEECWPSSYAIDISEDAEEIHGYLSDGTVLYIGTELCIRRLEGDSPDNFSMPNVLFNDVGLMAQDVWSVVFLEGTPVGTMWVTPDFRCIGSDFNTYDNVGVQIQSTLNTINPDAIKQCWAMAPQFGPFSFYVLALCTGTNTEPDTFCVYDMRLRKWYVWQCADQFISSLFYVTLGGTPRWIACDANGNIRNFDPTFVVDRSGDTTPVGITSTIQSTWLDLGDGNTRKLLNEMDLQSSDPAIAVTVSGASTIAGFASPLNLVTNATPIINAFGDSKVFLAGTPTKDKYYRYKVVSTSTTASLETDTILSDMSFEVDPMLRF